MEPGKTADVAPKPAWGTLPMVRPVHPFRCAILGIAVGVVLLPMTLFPKLSGNVFSRYMTVEAIVERGTLAIERSPMLERSGTPDIVKFGPHFYSDKPPVLPALASPIYGVVTLFGYRFFDARSPNPAFGFLISNAAVTWGLVGLGSALTVVWFRQMLQAVPIPRWVADLMAIALGFGSPLLTYGVTFNNHSVAAALIMGAVAFTVLERSGRGRARFLSGLFSGLAATVDLPVGCLILAGLGIFQAIRSRSIPWAFVMGAIGPMLLHAWLQSRVTGSPLPVEMYPAAFDYPGSYWMTPDGTFTEHGPRIWFGIEMLVGPQGWLTVTPALVFGLVGLGLVLARKSDPFRPIAWVVAGSVVILTCYYTWGVRRTDFAGASFGTRHLLAITPVCFVFAAVGLARLRGWAWPLAFIALMAIGATYAWIGVKDPWSRIERRSVTSPTLRTLQWFVPYPWSSMRR